MNFQVTVHPGNHRFTAEAGESILDAALRQGLNLPHGCREGNCGSCRGQLLEGQLTYPNGIPPALAQAEHDAGFALFCQARPESNLVIEVEGAPVIADTPIKQMPARVQRLEQLAHDVMAIVLQLPKGNPLAFRAGQYAHILLPEGQRRSYSIANPPNPDNRIELHVRRLPHGRFSEQVFTQMQARDLLRIRGPLGSFFLREDSDRPIILMGGGTGLAPLQGILMQAIEQQLGRPMHLFWGVRARRDLYRHTLLQEWAQAHANLQYTPVLSEPRADEAWQGATGFVHEAVLATYPDLSAHQVYMSGPPPMINAAKPAFAAHGLADDQLFYDAFEAAADNTS